MQKIKTEDFQKQLQEIDGRLMIVPNMKRPGASNIFLNGVDICSWIPSFEMQDEKTPDYTYQLDGMSIPFKTTGEAIDVVKTILKKTEDKEYADALFDAPMDVVEEKYGEHKA